MTLVCRHTTYFHICVGVRLSHFTEVILKDEGRNILSFQISFRQTKSPPKQQSTETTCWKVFVCNSVHWVGDCKFLVSGLTVTYVFSLCGRCLHTVASHVATPLFSSLSHFLFSLSGGKWILLLHPVSCMRSCQNS